MQRLLQLSDPLNISNQTYDPIHKGKGPQDKSRISDEKLNKLPKPAQAFVRAFRRAVIETMPMPKEPGLEPDYIFASLVFNNVRTDCKAKILEYSTVNMRESRVLSNDELLQYLDKGELPNKGIWNAGPWGEFFLRRAKLKGTKLTWINIGGIDWDVIKALQFKYQIRLQPFMEILRSHRAEDRPVYSRVDYYSHHLYICIVRHKLDDSYHQSISNIIVENMKMTQTIKEVQGELTDDQQSVPDSGAMNFRDKILSKLASFMERFRNRSGKPRDRHSRRNEPVVPVRTEPLFIILTRDQNTVISISPSTNLDFSYPIAYRLRTMHSSTLRRTLDPSVLVQNLLDLAVNEIRGVMEQFHKHIRAIELELINWNVPYLRKPTLQRIHTVTKELTENMAAFDTIKDVIRTICESDIERFRSLPPIETKIDPRPGEDRSTHGAPVHINTAILPIGTQANAKHGYFSPDSRDYLKDVQARMESTIALMTRYHEIAENLSDFTFNAKAYEINEIMRILTITSVIFLPLSVLTAYFGMNFIDNSAERHTEIFFWFIAFPLMTVLIICIVIYELGWSIDLRRYFTKQRRSIWHERHKVVSGAREVKYQSNLLAYGNPERKTAITGRDFV